MSLHRLTMHGDIAVLTLDNPPVNALSQAMRKAILSSLEQFAANPAAEALVVAGAGGRFIAGADLKEFDAPPLEPFLPQVIEAIQDCAKPVIAALDGNALGGGLEVALACHYRIAAASTKLGMPEVKLGLMPGARGTQLLPRLAGIERALQMIAFGEPIDARSARECGLVDAIASHELIDEAVAFARTVAAQPVVATRDRAVPACSPAMFDDFLAAHARRLRGLNAPRAIVTAIRASTEDHYPVASATERRLFLELREGPQCKALRHVFSAQRRARKLPELASAQARTVDKVGIVGAGTMGSGIALCFLQAGFSVTLVEQGDEALARGVATITRTLAANVASNRMSQAHADCAKALLRPTLDYADLADADLLIEAAYETIEVKSAVFARFHEVARQGAILATNTSYLDVDAIAAAGGRAESTVGLHFFSPANIMKLLEIVRSRQTSPEVLATALDLAGRIGKIPVVAGNAYGFIGNRMLAVRRRHAEAMIAQGASPYAIDRVIEDFGLPMGPFRIGDLAGLDLGWSPERSTGSTIRERLCEAGRRGQKSGRGFYDYDAERRHRPSDEVLSIIAGFARDQGLRPRSFSDEEIFIRLMWTMVDEGAQIVEEGIVRSRDEIDVVWIYGYGWPASTGGPMFHAATLGFAKVAADLRRMGICPSPALSRLADG